MSDETDAAARECARFLEWRGVEAPCSTCGGSGRRAYANTATWRGGIGGCAITDDVCDHCWGSGDEFRHGVDLRAQRAEFDASVRRAAEAFLTDRLGSCFYPGETFDQIVELLEAQTRKRSVSYQFKEVCGHLARAIRGMGKRTDA